jgi:transcriptional antiterminator Rof (Rho-off)
LYFQNQIQCLIHAADELVDELLAVAGITTLGEVDALVLEAAQGVGELERPQEVVGLLEVGSAGVDLMNEVLHADDVVLAEGLKGGVRYQKARSDAQLRKEKKKKYLIISESKDVKKYLLDDGVVRQGHALLHDLAEAALVHEVVDGLEGGLAVGDVRLDELEHGHGGEVHLFSI